jgi:hypothetical protein
MTDLKVTLRTPHEQQRAFIESPAKRKIVRAGRRGGKTVGAAVVAIRSFLDGKRVLYGVPTQEQVDRFWFEVKRALDEPLRANVLYKNETEHVIELAGTLQRIRAKTAWNADTLRGDFADLLILDEYQLMNEDAWELVGAPMMLDTNGDAIFIYTPPSVRSASVSKARDKMHAAKFYKQHEHDESGRWQCFTFTSHDNPHLSRTALQEIVSDMTDRSYRQEIMAQDLADNPSALWNRELLDSLRVTQVPELTRIVVALDPSATGEPGSDEAGIVAAGIDANKHGYVLEDASLRGLPSEWASAAVALYNKYHAPSLIAESNQGGEMVRLTINTIKGAPQVKLIPAKEGKLARATPVAAQYKPLDEYGKPLPGRVHHVGTFAALEDEMCNWMPGDKSPNRIDAMVYALTDLMIGSQTWVRKPIGAK